MGFASQLVWIFLGHQVGIRKESYKAEKQRWRKNADGISSLGCPARQSSAPTFPFKGEAGKNYVRSIRKRQRRVALKGHRGSGGKATLYSRPISVAEKKEKTLHDGKGSVARQRILRRFLSVISIFIGVRLIAAGY